MKASKYALIILVLSISLGIYSTIFIDPILATGFVASALIFQTYSRIKYRENRRKDICYDKNVEGEKDEKNK